MSNYKHQRIEQSFDRAAKNDKRNTTMLGITVAVFALSVAAALIWGLGPILREGANKNPPPAKNSAIPAKPPSRPAAALTFGAA